MPGEEQVLLKPTLHGGTPEPRHASDARDKPPIAAPKRHASQTMGLDRKEVTIRELSAHNEMRACIDLQKRVWRGSDLDVVPPHIFVVAGRAGGLVLVRVPPLAELFGSGRVHRDELIRMARELEAEHRSEASKDETGKR